MDMTATVTQRIPEDRVGNVMKWVLLAIAIGSFGLFAWATDVTYHRAPQSRLERATSSHFAACVTRSRVARSRSFSRIAPPLPSRRCSMTSLSTDNAISSGILAPRSRPAGAWTRPNPASATPLLAEVIEDQPRAVGALYAPGLDRHTLAPIEHAV